MPFTDLSGAAKSDGINMSRHNNGMQLKNGILTSCQIFLKLRNVPEVCTNQGHKKVRGWQFITFAATKNGIKGQDFQCWAISYQELSEKERTKVSIRLTYFY
jgi:hypothetical protein